MSDSDPITRLNAALEGRYRIESELGEGDSTTSLRSLPQIMHSDQHGLPGGTPEPLDGGGAHRRRRDVGGHGEAAGDAYPEEKDVPQIDERRGQDRGAADRHGGDPDDEESSASLGLGEYDHWGRYTVVAHLEGFAAC